MAFITLRQSNVIVSPTATIKGTPLTNSEVDNNFANLNVQVSNLSNTVSTLVTSEISNGTSNVTITTANGLIRISNTLIPLVGNIYDLGSPTNRFDDVFLSGNLNLDGIAIRSDDTGNLLIGGSVAFNSSGSFIGDINVGSAISNEEITGSKIANNTITSTQLNATGVAAATYGSNTIIPVFTTDVSGRITNATNATISLNSTNLNDSGVSAGTYGGASSVGQFTVDAKGRITSASSTSIAISADQITSSSLSVSRGGTGLTSSPSNGQLPIGNGSGYSLAGITGTTNRVTVTNGAGTITLSGPQDIATSSNVQFSSLGIGTSASGTIGEIRATNNITAYFSDRRLKKDINSINNALQKLLSISGVYFKSNETASAFGYTSDKLQVGVIAQQVEDVLPEIVVPAPFDIGKKDDGTEYSISGEDYKTVQYEKLIPLLIEAIKELNNKVENLSKVKNG